MAIINTANRDIRDIGIAFGVAVGVKIVWGLSLDLIDMAKARGKNAEKAKAVLKDTEALAEALAEKVNQEFPATKDILEEGARVQKQAREVTQSLVDATKEVSAIADAIEESIPDLGTFASAAGSAVEELAALLEDSGASNQELMAAQDLCKQALKAFQEVINMMEVQDGDTVLVDHQYRYANLLSCYELKLPALKKARAANARKAKTTR